jgi:hypothetical protein
MLDWSGGTPIRFILACITVSVVALAVLFAQDFLADISAVLQQLPPLVAWAVSSALALGASLISIAVIIYATLLLQRLPRAAIAVWCALRDTLSQRNCERGLRGGPPLTPRS